MSLKLLSPQGFLSLAVVLITSSGVWAAPAPEDKIAGTDAYGDVLPVGALARLGTERLTPGTRLLSFSPIGDTLASALGDTVWLWRIDTGKEIRRFRAPPLGERARGGVGGLTFSPDGSLIVAGYIDREANKPKVYIWEVATGKAIAKFENLPGSASRYLAFSPDGKTLVVNCGGPILLLDPIGGKEIDRWEGSGSDGPVAFADEGKTVLLLRKNGRKHVISLWDVAKGKERTQHELVLDNKYRFTLSPDGKAISAPTDDGKVICLFDPSTGKELRRTKESDAEAIFTAFTPDGSLFATSGREGKICVYETANGKLRHEFHGHTSWVEGLALSADGKLLASSSERQDQAIHLWDLAKAKELHSFTGHRGGPLTVAFLPDGKTLATVSKENDSSAPRRNWADWSLRLWDAASGKELRAVKTPQDGEGQLTAFSPDGNRLATLRHEGTLRIWDVHDGKMLHEWKGPRFDREDGGVVYTYHYLRALALSPDGQTLVTAGEVGIVRFWEVKTGKELRHQKMEVDSFLLCLYSPDGKALAVVAQERGGSVVHFLDAQTGQEIRLLRSDLSIRAFAFSADGKAFAVSVNNAVSVGEVASGGIRIEYPGRFSSGLAFSPDGRVLATSGQDGMIQFWHADASKPLCSLAGDRHGVGCLAFSPDGKMLASAGYRNTSYVWDAADILRSKLPDSVKLAPKDLEALWDDLANEDAAKAYRASTKLIAGAVQSVPWLQEKAKSFSEPDATRLDEWVKDLDRDALEVRQKAVNNLLIFGYWARPAVRKALAGELPSEQSRRLAKEILEKLATPPPECLREVRTLEVLEHIGTPEARKALEKIGEGKGPRQDEAKACLERLKKRGVGKSGG
jgi:WD40 repeat protein